MERRTFLKVATHSLGALFGAILGIPAFFYLIDARHRPAVNRDFKKVARLSDLKVGVPRQATITDIRRDAWTLYPNDVIGRVWLIRRENDKLDVFTTICPHLGCSINFEEQDKLFVCPCHNGTFDTDGKLVHRPGRNNPAPRGMDYLDYQLVEDPDTLVEDPNNPGKKVPDQFILVKYQNFIQGQADRAPKT